ncbi:MAG: hypothetical protein CBB87_07590 [Micavibrio sp. TMED27]|nr:hypothetical protein [Micavibrio sp.]OUT90983.1 MAG: hypothetical protein CBB87_07590 [Micavibrio sp. TMED27]|tara:strand:+ start:4780 stop:5364 length:585 start_codon:yes stop_codon:yes gene_type:complete
MQSKMTIQVKSKTAKIELDAEVLQNVFMGLVCDFKDKAMGAGNDFDKIRTYNHLADRFMSEVEGLSVDQKTGAFVRTMQVVQFEDKVANALNMSSDSDLKNRLKDGLSAVQELSAMEERTKWVSGIDEQQVAQFKRMSLTKAELITRASQLLDIPHNNEVAIGMFEALSEATQSIQEKKQQLDQQYPRLMEYTL